MTNSAIWVAFAASYPNADVNSNPYPSCSATRMNRHSTPNECECIDAHSSSTSAHPFPLSNPCAICIPKPSPFPALSSRINYPASKLPSNPHDTVSKKTTRAIICCRNWVGKREVGLALVEKESGRPSKLLLMLPRWELDLVLLYLERWLGKSSLFKMKFKLIQMDQRP